MDFELIPTLIKTALLSIKTLRWQTVLRVGFNSFKNSNRKSIDDQCDVQSSGFMVQFILNKHDWAC